MIRTRVPTPWLGGLTRELRLAARSLRRTPTFSLVTIASLGLGLAVATTTLAIVNAYLLRSLPYPDAERLYHVRYAPPGPYEPRGMTALDWNSIRDVVDATIVTAGDPYYLGDAGSIRFVQGMRVSPGFIDGLGVRPVLGRTFVEQDFRPGGPPIALLGNALWRDRFDADPNIVGREIRVNPESQGSEPTFIRIVGVLAPGFWFGRSSDVRPDMLLPMRTPARAYMVRLRAGVPVALAEQRITAAARAVGSDFRPGWTGVHLASAHERYVAELRPMLFGISAAAGLLLILVCTNVAVLVLLRALGRQKEVAVRVALGAERRHLLRMLIAEAGLVCAAALALGLALTMAALRTLEPVITARLGKPPAAGPSAIAVDSTVVMMIGGVGLLVALSMAFIPLMSSWRRQLAVTLRRGGHGATDGMAMRRLRSTLIALEVAGAFMLLAGGGLMIRSVLNLVRVDLGFDAEHVARIGVVLPASYREPLALSQFYEALAERLAGASPSSPVSSAFPPFYELNKRPLESDANSGGDLSIGVLPVGGGYFAVHGIAVRQGREFTPSDRLESQPVAIVSESLARELWPSGSAIGRRLRTTDESIEAPMGPWRTVVGVVGDVRRTYGDDELRDVYLPFLQAPTRFANLHVRTDRPSPVPFARLATIVAELDPRARVAEPKLLATEDQQFARARFMTALLSGCAGFATALALLGIYGVTAYAVLQREREIAIRVAVGASYRAVVRMFLREGAIVLALGVVLGVWGTSAAGRILESQIHGVKPFDIVTLLAACAVLVACGLLATWLPARQAARHDLLMVLKQE